jgi:hypothetical protein
VGVSRVCRRNAEAKWLLLENPNRSAICSIGSSGRLVSKPRALCNRLSIT